ncbi:MAG: carboxypeptidase-like regulatory domain-containing protein [bacterium]
MQHTSTLSKRLYLVALLLAAILPGRGQATTLSVTPTNLNWNANDWVNLAITGITPGSTVDVSLVTDVAANGVIDAGQDYVYAAFRFIDGTTNALGSSMIPDDDDVTANGSISSRIPYFGIGNMLHMGGAYIWAARPVGGTPDFASFRIVPPSGTTWVTGRVLDYYSSNAVAGALVQSSLSTELHYAPAVMTAPDGTFRLDLPPDVGTNEFLGVTVMRPGYLQDLSGSQSNILSGYMFPNDLHPGANLLPRSLYLLPCHSNDTHKISGYVYDDEAKPIAAALIGASDSGEERLGIAISDTNGYFEFPAAHGSMVEGVGFESSWLNMKGLIPGGAAIGLVTSDVANVMLYCPRASVLVRASVTDEQTGAPIPGVEVRVENDSFDNYSYTLSNGCYEIGVVTGLYRVTANDSIAPLGYRPPLSYEDVVIGQTGIFSNTPFLLQRGYILSGHVYTAETNALPSYAGNAEYNCNVMASLPNTGNDVGATWSFDRHGYYEMLVPTGSFRVVTSDFPGYIGQAYAHYYLWEWDDVLQTQRGDPVMVSTNGTSNINFYLPHASQIQGVVRGNGDLLPGIWVSVGEQVGENWEWRAGGSTDENGAYSLNVPPGSNYVVDVWTEGGGQFWLPQYYDHVADNSLASLITTAVDTPATNINFDLEKGGIISGWIYQGDTNNPVQRCWVAIETLDGSHVNSGGTYDTGYFEIIVPPGEYHVYAEGSGASAGVDMYYSGWFRNQREQANVVTAHVGEVTGNINFDMEPGGTISGRVTLEDGTTPVPRCYVQALINGDGMGDSDADEDGYYSIRVPPGTYTVVARPDWGNLPYLQQYFSNAVSQADALELTVDRGGEVSDVDFLLQQGGTVSGRIYVSADETAVGNCHVYAEDFESGEWMNGTFSGDDGLYTLRLPIGRSYRIRAVPSNNGLPYLDEWYSNTVDWAAAMAVDVASADDVGGIDFGLGQPSYIQGKVTDKDTGLPVAGLPVYAFSIPDTNDFWNNWIWYNCPPTDSNGSYSVAVSPGGNYIVQADSGESYYLGQCWSNQVDFMKATLLTVGPASTVANIDFTLESGGRISGHISRDDGGAPLGDCDVYAEEFLSGQGAGGRRSDSSGYYSLVVPAGRSYRVAAMPGNGYEPYVDEWFNDTLERDLAEEVPVTALNETGGINFSLMVSNLSYGDWKAHYFTTSELGATSVSGDDADPDEDGATNFEEYTADTDPRRRDSVLCVTGHGQVEGGLRLQWKGGRWAQQYIQKCESLTATGDVWVAIHTNAALPTVETNIVLDPDVVQPASFYRIKAER